MTNEYGTELDRNGYAPSILNVGVGCMICQRTNRHLQRHEVFHGANRAKSKSYGLWVNLCMECHNNVHHYPTLDKGLKREAQRHAMLVYKWTKDDFRRRFGKNYI